MKSDEFFTVTPFNPARGILFKHGTNYLDRAHSIDTFQEAVNFARPQDFVEMIGQYCEGGFDGFYRVLNKEKSEVFWTHLMFMKLLDEIEPLGTESRNDPLCLELQKSNEKLDTLRVLKVRADLFYVKNQLAFFPFGTAFATEDPDTRLDGYLAFDVRNKNSVIFLSRSGEQLRIASSFRDMMLHSEFAFSG